MIDITRQTEECLKKVKSFVESTPWTAEFSPRILRRLYELDQPCELAIAGAVKAGKSSFINALLEDDLAVVNVTEATATINVFKYGEPKDGERPIKVVWKDGTEEWQTRQFLDSLQGNTDEVLHRANNIDHLEYYLKNDILRSITLVDTPGTGSVVSEHNNRLADYLAQQNIQRSNKLKRKADAVIVLVGHVQSRGDSETVKMFTDSANPFNFLGIMSKIDDEFSDKREISLLEGYDYWRKRCIDYSERLKSNLHSIHPVSVLIHRRVTQFQKDGTLRWLQSILKPMPEVLIKKVTKSATRFEEPLSSSEEELENFGFGITVRRQVLEKFGNFTVLKVVLNALYFNSLDDAVTNLLRFAGINTLRSILDIQFFNRSRALRCHSALCDVQRILSNILDVRLPEMRRTSQYKDSLITAIDNTYFDCAKTEEEAQEMRQLITRIIRQQFWSESEISNNREIARKLLVEVEKIKDPIIATNLKSEGLLLIEQNRNQFSPKEVEELEILFGKNGKIISFMSVDDICIAKSQWSLKLLSAQQRERRKVIKAAIDLHDRFIEEYIESAKGINL